MYQLKERFGFKGNKYLLKIKLFKNSMGYFETSWLVSISEIWFNDGINNILKLQWYSNHNDTYIAILAVLWSKYSTNL